MSSAVIPNKPPCIIKVIDSPDNIYYYRLTEDPRLDMLSLNSVSSGYYLVNGVVSYRGEPIQVICRYGRLAKIKNYLRRLWYLRRIRRCNKAANDVIETLKDL